MSATAVNHRGYAEALKRMRRKNPALDEVADLLSAAHAAGDARATYALATWHLHGRFFRKSIRKAVALFRQAARHNVPDALFDLAICYELGEGVQKNEKTALELYLRAALQGDQQSVHEVGRCYYYGIGVKRDRDVADVWLARAEQLGVKE